MPVARLSGCRPGPAAPPGGRGPRSVPVSVPLSSPFQPTGSAGSLSAPRGSQFLRRLRIDRAKRLLAREQLPVTEVCFAVGYESLGSFSSLFRTMVGYSPSEYQRAIRRIFAAPELAPYRFVPGCFLLNYGARPF
ncbi:MAG: hypothetical protein DMG59_04390 [Acidobacteria bacterium]|nr:MAG: hypothetical protein DMG59_04390 [Acidobacteriota bacterium]